MKTKYQYIHFEAFKNTWWCYNNRYGSCLGEVIWNKEWKQWIFQAEELCDFSASCLLDIVDFIKQLKVPEA